jgi:transcriptional regulator with XRE-family HTH domain
MYFGAKPMTTFASICMVVLREIRIANGYSLEALSDRLNIKSQEWHSMETGGRDLQFETFVRACHQLNTKPAQVICLSERYAEILAALGWDILYNRITKGNDNLLESAKGYWASPGGSGCFRDMPIWQDPTLIFNGPSLVAPFSAMLCTLGTKIHRQSQPYSLIYRLSGFLTARPMQTRTQ